MNISLARAVTAAAAVAIALLPGCTSIPGDVPALVPNRAFAVSRSLSVPLDVLVLAAGVVVVVDPLAPNWQVEERSLGQGRYAFALTKKRFTTGGDGEALPVLRRRIETITRQQGYAGHAILEYAEGIDSGMPIAQRVSRAVVQFAAAP